MEIQLFLLKIINHDAERIERLITDYSQMLKDEASLTREKMKKIDLNLIINNVVEDFKHDLLNNNKKVSEDKIENCTKENQKNIYKELYKRFLIPFYIPLLVLVPFLLILSSKESSNYSKLKIITFLIGLFFIIFSETTIKIISSTYFKNIVISSIPFLLLLFLYLIFLKKTNFKFSN